MNYTGGVLNIIETGNPTPPHGGSGVMTPIDRACQEPTLVKALAYIALWESERIVRWAREHDQWDSCFEFLIGQVMERYRCPPQT